MLACLVVAEKAVIRKDWRGYGYDFGDEANRDLITGATLAFDSDDTAEQQQAQKSWKQLADKFWERTAKDDQEKKLKAPKLCRTGPYKSLIRLLAGSDPKRNKNIENNLFRNEQ